MRKQLFVALASITCLAAGCSTETSETTSKEESTTAQKSAFEVLQKETGKSWLWIQHDEFGTPTHLSAPRTGPGILARNASVELVTKRFLAEHKALFAMKNPDAELRMTKSEVDDRAMTHARFQQQVRGIRVVGAEMMVHYDAEGRLTSLDATYVPGISDLDVQPALSLEQAQAKAKDDALALVKSDFADRIAPAKGELVVHATGPGSAALAYRFETRAIFGNEPAIWITTIDAKTGAVLHRYNNLQTIDGTGTGVLGDIKTISIASTGNGYQLTDTSRGVTISTYSAGSQQVTAEQGAQPVTSNTSTLWDQVSPGAGAAVDAHFYAGVVYDYYKKVHNRNAIDGAGSAMLSAAHFGSAYDNAFWDGESMSYGDGGQLFKPLSAGLDVCAHEFTHGVTQSTSNLDYQGQSGALNEAVSDIFGVFIEHSLKPSDTNNWLMGEAIAKGDTLRDFKNPANGQQPDNMQRYVNTQQDNGGVHINSGIVNNADYLLTMGGKNPTSGVGPAFGIGWEKSEQLWYRVNTKYLTTSSRFSNAAQATMQAAKDLSFTDNEINIIDCAWKGTGVVQGTCATVTDPQAKPQSTPPSGGTDGTTGGRTGSTTGSDTGDESTGDTGDTDTSDPAPATTKKKRSVAIQSGGCNTAGTSGNAGNGALVLAAAALGLALSRRRR
jgi:Zn-dependent metalloprotease